MAKTAAQIWNQTHAASILHYFREMGSSHLVDDTCGLHSVKLEQKTLQGYLEMAFTAGESAEFERLDRRAKQGDARALAIMAELAQPAAPQEGSINPEYHECDEDVESGLCRICHVEMTAPCPTCGGLGYHAQPCAALITR